MMLPAWGWFVPGLGLGIWIGAWATVYFYRHNHTLCALCRAELPHQSNASRRKED